jgi:CRP/FNR family transcriptional regulator, cyclic AMP receptor protein
MAVEPLAATAFPRPRWPARTAALLDLNPELGAAMSPDRFARARAELVVRILSLPRGEWARDGLSSISQQNVGLLTIDGVIAHEVVLEDTVSTELLGAGDLLRPWAVQEEPQLLGKQVRWQVLADAQLAVLGRPFGLAAVRFPEINAVLMDRLCTRAQRLATTQAISHLNSVDRRLLALFWHLAERWGRMTCDGVVVPLTLSHRLLAEIIGARRPTVTTALRSLEREGKLVRREDATWLLTGDAPGAPAKSALRVVSHRRKLFAPDNNAARVVRQ